jgi:hypothetical protein
MITKEISEAYTVARDMLIAEDPDLAEKVRDVVEARREYGKFKR